MRSVYNFVVTPEGKRYNNKKKIGDSELILNTEIYNHEYVNRRGVVVSCPIAGKYDVLPGDDVIVHHNVFRRWPCAYSDSSICHLSRVKFLKMCVCVCVWVWVCVSSRTVLLSNIFIPIVWFLDAGFGYFVLSFGFYAKFPL